MSVSSASTKGAWRSDLFNCCSGGCGTCVYACCCPSCASATARTRYDGSNFCFNCCFVGPFGNYNVVREGHGIAGDCIGDVLTVCCCMPCSAIRLLNHTEGLGRDNWKKTGNNRFEHSLFDCCAAGTASFCLSFICCCSPCLAAKARTDFDNSNVCFNYCCLTPCSNYNIVREGSGIEGSCATDILKACCCLPCAAVQLKSQVPH